MTNMTRTCLTLILLLAALPGRAQQYDGFTFYGVFQSNLAYLLDTNGTVVKTWTFASGSKTGYSCYLDKGGTIWRTVARTGNSFTGGPICGEVQKIDWNGNIVWDYVYSTTSYCTHHDICPMPNGNVLLIAYERKTATEAAAAGATSSIEMWPDKIVEVKPTGATTGDIVWEWHAWDHLVQNVNSAKANYQTSIVNHPELLNINYKTAKDWMHMNGVDYNADLDQIAFSCHNLNEIYVIDHSTTTAQAASHSGGNSGKGGDILYRWGNPAAYGASGTAVLNVVHDAHWVPKGCPRENYLVGFNNGGTTSASTVDMANPPVSGSTYTITPGQAFTPTSYDFRQVASGKTSNMGNSHQLPNGNMLITVALAGTISEVNANGTTLWSKNAGGTVAQAFRYPRCYILATSDSTPTVTLSNDTLYSSATSGNQWYLDGNPVNGATSRYIVPTQNGIYRVSYTDVLGCKSKQSAPYNYLGLFTGKPGAHALLQVYPNPTSGTVRLAGLVTTGGGYLVRVFDISGRTLLETADAPVINLSHLPNGVYYLNVMAPEQGSATTRIVLTR